MQLGESFLKLFWMILNPLLKLSFPGTLQVGRGCNIIWTLIIWMVVHIHSENVKLIFGGDVTFSGVLKYHAKGTAHQSACTYNQSFTQIKPHLKEADHVIINLETPFRTKNDEKHKPLDPSKWVTLISDLEAMTSLSYAGIDMVTLANNHIIDYGEKPAKTTVKNLRKLKIKYMGVTYGKNIFGKQKPLIITKNGTKIGFLAYCAVDEGCLRKNYRSKVNIGPAVYKKELAQMEIKSLRQKVDIIIVFMHMGDEYSIMLSPSSGRCIAQMAPLVDVIVGCHPHVTQDHFYHNGTLVIPSLGNMLFPLHGTLMNRFQTENNNGKNETSLTKVDKVWAKETKKLKNPSAHGMLVKIELNKKGVVRDKTEYLPIEIDMSNKHCLFIKSRGNWQTLCDENDKYCTGTDSCNVIACDGMKKKKPIKIRRKKPKHTDSLDY